MEKGKLDKAFENLKREDLEEIIKKLNQDFYIGKMIEEEINKILTPENVNERLINDALSSLKLIRDKMIEIENSSSRRSYGIQFTSNDIRSFFNFVKDTLNKYISLFIDHKLYKEGVRFTVALITILLNSQNEEIANMNKHFDVERYYELLIEKGNLDENKVLHFRNMFEGKIGISIKEIFNGESITL